VLDPALVPGPEHSFAIAGLTPIVVPNPDFYRIDTALVVRGGPGAVVRAGGGLVDTLSRLT
jgi:hypothetical protein